MEAARSAEAPGDSLTIIHGNRTLLHEEIGRKPPAGDLVPSVHFPSLLTVEL